MSAATQRYHLTSTTPISSAKIANTTYLEIDELEADKRITNAYSQTSYFQVEVYFENHELDIFQTGDALPIGILF